jgi:hypothetical protein
MREPPSPGLQEKNQMEEKIKLGISSCLLGEKVRYNGGHALDRFLADVLGQYVDYVPVCPEVEIGLPVPRETLRLVKYSGDETPRLAIQKTGLDYTVPMLTWARSRLEQLEKEELCGFMMGYFKKQLDPDEKQELVEVIEHYRLGYYPLVVPLTLLKHYVRKYDQPYLQDQYYLNPHPVELKLRNHA